MAWKHILLQLSALAGAYASPPTDIKHLRADKLTWKGCGLNDTSTPVQCTNLTVPRDYTDPSSHATLNLQLLKVPAIHTPKKGSILLNFGGPGLESRLTLAALSKRMLALTGGEYDLIAHDPRGTAQTFTARCFNSTASKTAVYNQMNYLAEYGDELAMGRYWGGTQVLSNACYDFPGFKEKGSLIGTAFTARDLMQIVDAVEDDGLLRYYGFSYGTTLGATVAAMFPDRIDRIILDGVLNPHQYFHSYDTEIWADADMVFASFIQECLQAPNQCGFAHRNESAFDLNKDIYNLLEEIKREPRTHGTTLIDSTILRTFIRFALYAPDNFSDLSRALDFLLSGNMDEFLTIFNAHMSTGLAASLSADESALAIQCGDKNSSQHSFSEMGPVFDAFNDETRLFSSSGISLAMACANWKIQAKERYEGKFNVKTKHPMLVIGNTYDSATPLRSARNISEGFEGSVLLEHGGFGHASMAQGSACTIRAIREYFSNGTLPEPGTVCKTDYGPFEDMTIDDLLVKLGFMSR